jgi:hypothetical protein
MIITKKTAIKHAKLGNAIIENCTTFIDGVCYQIVTRHDKQRVDHFVTRND